MDDVVTVGVTYGFLNIGLQSHSTIQTFTGIVGVLAEVRLVVSVEELTVSPIHDVLVDGWMVFLDPIHVLRTHFLGTSITSMPIVLLQFLVNLLPFIRLSLSELTFSSLANFAATCRKIC